MVEAPPRLQQMLKDAEAYAADRTDADAEWIRRLADELGISLSHCVGVNRARAKEHDHFVATYKRITAESNYNKQFRKGFDSLQKTVSRLQSKVSELEDELKAAKEWDTL